MDIDNSMTTTDVSNEIVAPSHRVPPEIVVEIIHELLPTNIDYNPQMQKRLDVLLTATSICRYWRCAAIDHATLWSVISMDRGEIGELFLQRSRNVPLSVTFEAKNRECSLPHQAMVSLLSHMQRVEKVYFRAPGAVLNTVLSTLNRLTHSGQLKEISVQVDRFPGDVNLDLLLEHASALKVLRTDVSGSHLDHKLRQFSHLTHLELLTTHSIRDVLSLLISLPALTSTKVCVNARMRGADNHRILLPVNLRHIHLRINCYAVSRILNAMKIPAGVHLKCEISTDPHDAWIRGQARWFTLAPEFFENASHIEELRISLPLCSGSGPNGSFCVEWITDGEFHLPIEDFSLLRKLVVDSTVDQRSLEHVVTSAPRLVSVVFINCAVIKPRTVGRPVNTLSSLVDTDVFVKTINKGYGADTNAGPSGAIVVNGTLEGERLGEFRSLLENWKEVGERGHT